MTRRARLWLLAASLFTLINLAGAGIAAFRLEVFHTGLHGALLLLGGYVMWRIVRGPTAGEGSPADIQPVSDRLERLQQSLDAVAVEVERIGEGQRFMTRLEQERAEARH